VTDASAVSDVFNAIVATFDSPMFVVTAFDGNERDGCLVGFATQCSIDPARFLVCLSVRNHTYRIAQRARTLVVHSLRAGQHDLAERFGAETGDEVDKFSGIAWSPGPDGAPVIQDCDWFAGSILDRHELGDHQGVLIDVTDARRDGGDSTQLGFQAVRDLDAGHDA
jgi:flavin reductase (DIM6/NTAB) family NADH-FMN oxidoreductase RutF